MFNAPEVEGSESRGVTDVGNIDGAKLRRWKPSFKYICKDLFLPRVPLPDVNFCRTPLHDKCNVGRHRIPDLTGAPPRKYWTWRVEKLMRKRQDFLVITVALAEHISHRAISYRL